MKISDKGLQEILSLGLKKETSVPGVYFVYEWDDVKYLAVPSEDSETPQEYSGAVKILLTPEQYKTLKQNTKEAPSSAQNEAQDDAATTASPTTTPVATTSAPHPATASSTPAKSPDGVATQQTGEPEVQTKQGVLQPQTEPMPKASALDSEKFSDTISHFENLILLIFDTTQNIFIYKAGHGTNSNLQKFTCGIDKPSPLKIIYDTKKPFHGKYHAIDNFDKCLKEVDIEIKNLWITAYPLVSGGRLVGAVIAFSNKKSISAQVLEKFKNYEESYIDALAAKS